MKKFDFQSTFNDSKTSELIQIIMNLATIASLNNKLLIVQGGFAVDLAYGRLTRVHDDLDLITLESELDFFKEELIKLGHKMGSYDPNGYSFFAEKEGIHIDFDSVQIDESLDQVSDFDQPYRYIWPVKASELFSQIEVDGVVINYANPSLVKEFKEILIKSGKEKRAKEDHDLKILNSVIG